MNERVLQSAYPQALSILIGMFKDIQNAEDALQSAVEKALLKWPRDLPDNPVAWLIQVARNEFIDQYRKRKRDTSIDNVVELTSQPDLSEQALLLSYNDDILRLIFTCCHPALNLQTQIILALKHVLGLTVSEIANALLINRTTLEQRLLRAKKKIQANQIQYQTPSENQWSARLDGVLKTIYLLFNEGYLATQANNETQQALCHEAIRLARLLASCCNNHFKTTGLLALLLHQDARAPARFDSTGQIVLLAQQQRNLWKQANIQEANTLVEKSLRAGGASTYALQAAIAALHNNATKEVATDWQQIYQLYEILQGIDSNPVIQLNAAIALAKTGKRMTAIEKILRLQPELSQYRHWHTSLAALYLEEQQLSQAKQHYQAALSLTESEIERQFIQAKLTECDS